MEPITSLLDAFIKLADKVISLEKTRLQDKKDLFNQIVKPLFEELEPVASNYIELFRRARKTVNKSSLKKVREISELVVEERENMLVARRKVEQMAFQIGEYVKEDEVENFARAIVLFFYDTTTTEQSRAGYFLMQLEQIEANTGVTGKLSKGDRKSITDFLDSTLSSLEKYWIGIVQSYEKLKIYSVSSPKFIHRLQSKKSTSR